MKHFVRWISTLLVLIMLLNTVPAQALQPGSRGQLGTEAASAATEVNTAYEPVVEEASIVSEVLSGRTKYGKEFLLDNGLHMAAVYPDAVHYLDGDSWKEIDNTLQFSEIDGKMVYTNTSGIWDVRLPQSLSQPVTVEKDGYSLSFTLSGALKSKDNLSADSSAQIVGSGDATIQPLGTNTAQIQELDIQSRIDNDTHPEAVVSTLYSRLGYENILPNTDVIYDLTSNSLKESVVLESKDSNLLGYSYTLQVGSLQPVLGEDGHIDFWDENKENIIFTMPAPYLVDDNLEYNREVQVQLAGKGGTYILVYLLPRAWLAQESRAWPVILDPVIQADLTTSNIQDIDLASNGVTSHLDSTMVCGYHPTTGIRHILVKYTDLPELSSADVIVGASVTMTRLYTASSADVVEVHKVLNNWQSSGLTWENHPGYDPIVEDHLLVRSAGNYTWDITGLAQGWYSGENTGMLFRSEDAVENGGVRNLEEFYSSDYGVLYKPTVYITFRNNNGLESYWQTTSASAGRAGTGYVNQYTGNLTWVHSDIGFGGNRMPVSISHVYNAHDREVDTFGVGNGWRTNLNQLVYKWSQNSDYYVWEDGDGTKHYFWYDSTKGYYVDEDGLELELRGGSAGTKRYNIKDKNGNVSYFDSNGRLTSLENNQQTKSTVTLTYTSATGKLIDTVTDGAGRVYKFNYTNGLLSAIDYKGNGTAVITGISYGYTGNNLTSVTYADNETATFQYDANGLLLSAQDIDGYKLAYTYSTTAEGKPSRVASVTEYDGTVLGSSLSLAYAHNQTTITDHKGNKQLVQFNDWGNTVSVQDDEGRAVYSRYAVNKAADKSKGNQLTLSSKMQNTVVNTYTDGSFEFETHTASASGISSAVSTEQAYIGQKALKVVSTAAASMEICSYSIAPGETVTVSAYIKVTQGAAGLTDSGSGNTQTASGWERVQFTDTNSGTSTAVKSLSIIMDANSIAYVDCVQVEKAPTASRYNLVENGDFTTTTRWTLSGGESADGRTTATATAPKLDENVYSLTGNARQQKRLSQTVQVSGAAGDTFVLAGWAKGDAVQQQDLTDEDKERYFGLRLVFHGTDGAVKESEVAPFNPDVNSQVAWQYTAAPIVAEVDYSYVEVQILYDYNANTVLFDGIQLYKEEFGSSYTRDEDGNIISVKDLQGQTTSYEYQNNDLTKAILPTGAELSYTYDDYHNVLTATSEEGIAYGFTYDTYGNNLSVAINSGEQSISTSATYSTDGNRMVSATDAAGNTTQYSYDENTNVLNWIQYPGDTEKTQYTYDSLYRLANTTAQAGTETLTATYGYTEDLLTTLTTGSSTYHFTYGDFSLRDSISVGNRQLASYDYTAQDHQLSQLTYGNDQTVSYTYDDQGRVTAQTYNNGDTVTYTYDNTGALAAVYNSATGRTTTYYYDFTDRLMKYVEGGTGYNHTVEYGYDNINNLTSLVETINGNAVTQSFTYDEDNRLTSVSNGTAKREYTFDGFSRVDTRKTYHGTTQLITDTIQYRNVSDSVTTGQIERLTTVAGESYNKTYIYSYDTKGNIISIREGSKTTTYTYDSAGQLLREDNQLAGRTWVWTYDDAGNILSKKGYAYTTDSLGESASTVSYGYTDPDWGDLLTSYNGNTITYDEIGNPLSDGTWSYTWQHGRQLASMSNGTTTWNFTYNSDGLRTQKTNGTTTYNYTYNGSSLSQMTVGNNTLRFFYDANGVPVSVDYNGTTYYYATNVQGDVMAILDANGTEVARYVYDAWGRNLAAFGTLQDTLGTHNPLRYRGYVYDVELKLYYLQSRYYNPYTGRFINADAYAATGQGLLGNNMFTYCNNNPIMHSDPTGKLLGLIVGIVVGVSAVVGAHHTANNKIENSGLNEAEQKLAKQNYFRAYKVYQAREDAVAITKAVYQIDTIKDGTPANAFKHIMWNVFMTYSIGVYDAKAFADAHENFEGNEINSKNMDLHNNALGRQLAMKYNFWELDKIITEAKEMIDSGEAIVLVWD